MPLAEAIWVIPTRLATLARGKPPDSNGEAQTIINKAIE